MKYNSNDLFSVLNYIKVEFGEEIFETTKVVSILQDLAPNLKRDSKVLKKLIETRRIEELKRIAKNTNEDERKGEIHRLEMTFDDAELISPETSDYCIQAIVGIFSNRKVKRAEPGLSNNSNKVKRINQIPTTKKPIRPLKKDSSKIQTVKNNSNLSPKTKPVYSPKVFSSKTQPVSQIDLSTQETATKILVNSLVIIPVIILTSMVWLITCMYKVKYIYLIDDTSGKILFFFSYIPGILIFIISTLELKKNRFGFCNFLIISLTLYSLVEIIGSTYVFDGVDFGLIFSFGLCLLLNLSFYVNTYKLKNFLSHYKWNLALSILTIIVSLGIYIYISSHADTDGSYIYTNMPILTSGLAGALIMVSLNIFSYSFELKSLAKIGWLQSFWFGIFFFFSSIVEFILSLEPHDRDSVTGTNFLWIFIVAISGIYVILTSSTLKDLKYSKWRLVLTSGIVTTLIALMSFLYYFS